MHHRKMPFPMHSQVSQSNSFRCAYLYRNKETIKTKIRGNCKNQCPSSPCPIPPKIKDIETKVAELKYLQWTSKGAKVIIKEGEAQGLSASALLKNWCARAGHKAPSQLYKFKRSSSLQSWGTHRCDVVQKARIFLRACRLECIMRLLTVRRVKSPHHQCWRL